MHPFVAPSAAVLLAIMKTATWTWFGLRTAGAISRAAKFLLLPKKPLLRTSGGDKRRRSQTQLKSGGGRITKHRGGGHGSLRRWWNNSNLAVVEEVEELAKDIIEEMVANAVFEEEEQEVEVAMEGEEDDVVNKEEEEDVIVKVVRAADIEIEGSQCRDDGSPGNSDRQHFLAAGGPARVNLGTRFRNDLRLVYDYPSVSSEGEYRQSSGDGGGGQEEAAVDDDSHDTVPFDDGQLTREEAETFLKNNIPDRDGGGTTEIVFKKQRDDEAVFKETTKLIIVENDKTEDDEMEDNITVPLIEPSDEITTPSREANLEQIVTDLQLDKELLDQLEDDWDSDMD